MPPATSAPPTSADKDKQPSQVHGQDKEAEYSGKNVNYYLVDIPTPKRLAPYSAECEDIIEALNMTFAEGCAFKAIWRSCAARTLGKQKKGQDVHGVYDAQKVEYYGARMVAVRTRLKEADKAKGKPVGAKNESIIVRSIFNAICDAVANTWKKAFEINAASDLCSHDRTPPNKIPEPISRKATAFADALDKAMQPTEPKARSVQDVVKELPPSWPYPYAIGGVIEGGIGSGGPKAQLYRTESVPCVIPEPRACGHVLRHADCVYCGLTTEDKHD